MQTIFEKISHPRLRGTLIWEPMLAEDDFAAAKAQQKFFQDSRVEQYWDAGKVLGKIIADSMLENTPVAWDIYLLYKPGARWEGEKFPAPDFWMHQLSEDESLRLDPEVLQYQVMVAITNLQK